MIREAESPALEERMAKLEGIVEQMNRRLNHLEDGMAQLRSEIAQLRSEMTTEIAQLRADLQTNFRWLLGIMIATWVTIMLTLLFKP